MPKRVTSGKRDGLLVGTNYYSDPDVSDLRFAVADASEIHNVLLATPYNFTKNRLIILKSINAQNNEVLRRNILRRLYDVAHNGRVGDLLLFYYAGHGVSINGLPYLCPADVERNLLRETSIPLSQIREIIAQSQASIKLMILDACQVGVSLGQNGNRATLVEDAREFREQTRKLFKDVRGIAMLAASSLEEIAIEIAEKKHGAFTWCLLEALRNPYAVEQNRDGLISITELFNYVSDKLKREYKQEATIVLESSGDLPIFTLSPHPQKMNPVSEVFPQPVKKPQDFFGRQDALRRVREKLLNTADILVFVHGERGIGKTSFLNRIKTMLEQENYLDLRFLHFAIEPGGIQIVGDFARELWNGLAGVCQKSSPEFSWEKPFSFDSYTQFCFELEEMLRPFPNNRFVVFIDSIEIIRYAVDNVISNQIIGLIRFIIDQTNLPIAFVVSSTYDPIRFFTGYKSPEPKALDILLPLLDPATCHELLDSIFPVDIAGKEGLYDKIYLLAAGNPYFTKLVAYMLYDIDANLSSAPEVEWEQIISFALKESSNDFFAIYNDMGDEERFVLLSLASKSSFGVSATEVTQWKVAQRTAARILEDKFYLVPMPGGGYRLRMRLLGEWLRRWQNFILECERLVLTPPETSVSLPSSDGICVDESSGKVYLDGREIEARLSDLQYQALCYLVRNTNRVISRKELYKILHAQDGSYLPSDQSLGALIYRLRLALGDRQQRYLQTLRRRGYRLIQGSFIGSK